MINLVKNYGKEMDWNVGTLFCRDKFMIKVLDVCKEIGEDSHIKYVFGSIPCALAGGRVTPRTASLKDAIEIMYRYNARNVGCRLTFSRIKVTKEDIHDELSNALLKAIDIKSDKFINGVMVVDDELAKYIKDKYPNIEVISSQVKPSYETNFKSDDYNYYNKLFDLYDLIVVNPARIYDNGFLVNLKNHDRVEFIANHDCVLNCPIVGHHYLLQDELSRALLNHEDYVDIELEIMHVHDRCADYRKEYPFSTCKFTESDINMLLNMGFKHFKIEGRDSNDGSFIRDLGDTVFEWSLFSSFARAYLGGRRV